MQVCVKPDTFHMSAAVHLFNNLLLHSDIRDRHAACYSTPNERRCTNHAAPILARGANAEHQAGNQEPAT